MFNTQSQVTEHLTTTTQPVQDNTNAFAPGYDSSVPATTPTVAQKYKTITIEDLVTILTNNATTYKDKYDKLTPYNSKNNIISESEWGGYDDEVGWNKVYLFFTRKIIAELEIIYMMMQWDINKKITQANLSTLDLLKDLGVDVHDTTYYTRVAMFAANRVEMDQQFHNVEDSYGNSPYKTTKHLLSIYTHIYDNNLGFDNYLIKPPRSLNLFPQHVSDIMVNVSKIVYTGRSSPPSLFLINDKYSDTMPSPTENTNIFKLGAAQWDNLYYELTGDQNRIKNTEQRNVSMVSTTTVPTTTVPTTTVPTTTATVARNEAVTPAFLPLTKTTLIIDSRYRDNYHTTFSNNSTFTLNGDGLSNVVELKLTSVHIKNNSYNINMNNNLLRMNIQVQDVKRATDNIQNIIIPKGNYYQNKNDPETNLDLQIKELFNLYEEFKNVAVYFNYKNNKYYFYQTYAYLLTEHSHMYNILFNFGTTISSRYTGDNYKQGRPPEGAEKTNRLFTNTGDGGFTKIEQFSALNDNSLFNTIKKDKKFANFSIGQYLGFYPNNYSTHISNNVSVNYFQDDTIQDSSKKNYNILQFNIKNSETLFQKIYNLIILAKEDMFIGFVLNNLLDNNNCKHAILKLEPGFCSNIITHRSTSTSTDIVGTPPPAGAPGDAADNITYTIEIYLKNKLHQFPKFNNLIEPQNVTLNSTVNVFSDIIILPVISDKPYELNNDNYMLMNLKLGGSNIINIDSTSHAPSSVLNSFTQFRTEVGNDYFVNTGAISIKQFPSGKTLTTLTVTLYDKNDALFDLNNTDYSFLLECTEVAPQSGAYVKHLVGKQ